MKPLSVASFAVLAAASNLAPQTINVLVRPATPASSPIPYLDLHYDPSSLTANILKQYPLPPLPEKDPLVSIGFYRHDLISSSSPKEDAFASINLPPFAFEKSQDRTVELLVDRDGLPQHIGFTSVPAEANLNDTATDAKLKTAGNTKTKREAVDGSLKVEVVQQKPGPKPVLNKPVVVGRDGRVEGQEPEKTFLQKYWWAIAIFLVINVVAGGGGEGK